MLYFVTGYTMPKVAVQVLFLSFHSRQQMSSRHSPLPPKYLCRKI